MVAYMTTLLGEVGELKVYGGIPSDFHESWECLLDCHQTFFLDNDEVRDQETFMRFMRANVRDVAVAREGGPGGRIVCVGYIITENRHSACFHGYCAPEYRSPAISLLCARLGINYFFDTYKLERMSVMGRWGNRVARLYAMRQGFTIEGRLRKFLAYRGEFVDAYYGSMLKGEGV